MGLYYKVQKFESCEFVVASVLNGFLQQYLTIGGKEPLTQEHIVT